jgi:hypothetical protein
MHDWKSCFSTNILLVDTRVITFGNVSRKKLVIAPAMMQVMMACGMLYVLPTLMLRGVWASGDTIHS